MFEEAKIERPEVEPGWRAAKSRWKTRRRKTRIKRRHADKVWEETGWRCVYCDQTPAEGERSVDHLWPNCKGGTRGKYNLVGACKRCNEKRGTKLPASKYCHPKWQEHVRRKERAMGMNAGFDITKELPSDISVK